MNKYFLIASILVLTFFGYFYFQKIRSPVENCEYRIAAFDIGSGTTKLKIAKIDRCKKKNIEFLTYVTMPVPYAQNMKENNGRFDQAIIDYGTKIISRFIKAAKSLEVKKIVGVATSAFRKSDNGRELIGKWNNDFDVNFRVIDQREEALIGFDSVRMGDAVNYAVWDIGGGSMQIVENTEGKPFIYLGNIASVSFKNEVIKKLNKEGVSPNPMTRLEFISAVNLSMELFNNEISDNKLKNFPRNLKFIGIGGLHKSLLEKGKKGYSYEDLVSRADRFVGMTDQEINSKYSDTMVTNIALVIGFMKLFKIKEVFVEDVVLSDGLIYQDLVY